MVQVCDQPALLMQCHAAQSVCPNKFYVVDSLLLLAQGSFLPELHLCFMPSVGLSFKVQTPHYPALVLKLSASVVLNHSTSAARACREWSAMATWMRSSPLL